MNILTLPNMRQSHTYFKLSVMMFFSFLLSSCSQSPTKTMSDDHTGVYDPYESTNRVVQRFNDKVDSIGLKPTAKGYVSIVPEPIERGVSNFFSNLEDPLVAINQVLQGKVTLGVSDSARFIFNSTFGLAGLIDIASPMGLEKHEEDFGQTFAVWGVGSGPHLNLPFWGPTNFRDGVGSIAWAFANPIGFLDDVPTRNGLAALSLIDKRASLLSTESIITGDRYLFIRDVFNQRREFLIKDGEVEDAFLDGVDE